MFSKWSVTLLAVSVSLCVGTLLLSGRSYFYADVANCLVTSTKFYLAAESQRGLLSIGFVTFNKSPPQGMARWGGAFFPIIVVCGTSLGDRC